MTLQEWCDKYKLKAYPYKASDSSAWAGRQGFYVDYNPGDQSHMDLWNLTDYAVASTHDGCVFLLPIGPFQD